MSPSLRRITTLQREREKLGLALHAAVHDAREKGSTWQEVADSLGVTRQAAQQRFS